jgi:hypothetical protein
MALKEEDFKKHFYGGNRETKKIMILIQKIYK